MSTKQAQPTESEVLAKSQDWGMTIEETRATMIQDAIQEQTQALRKEFERLSALDLSEYKELVDNANCNAAETCREEGISDFEGLRFYQMAVATLECELDAAGIETR